MVVLPVLMKIYELVQFQVYCDTMVGEYSLVTVIVTGIAKLAAKQLLDFGGQNPKILNTIN